MLVFFSASTSLVLAADIKSDKDGLKMVRKEGPAKVYNFKTLTYQYNSECVNEIKKIKNTTLNVALRIISYLHIKHARIGIRKLDILLFLKSDVLIRVQLCLHQTSIVQTDIHLLRYLIRPMLQVENIFV